ncbi:hypothetical protein Mucpa_1625 [Mucilaginibacter paludis DSM 18603]|uniref:Uncharacterized protein n=1 Tax=Mucilaginibacter paludis DSM 18603 TaxID=714943 RepID=H1Y4E8_9SPHI|nr:hypothetical protein Mucpa_1625 [Mucilaginibacter paludis DSM 18603]
MGAVNIGLLAIWLYLRLTGSKTYYRLKKAIIETGNY